MKRRFPLYNVSLVFVILVAAVVHAVGVGRLVKGPLHPKPPAYTPPPLVAAILRRDAAGVKTMLRRGADPSVRYDRQHSGSVIPGISQLSHGPTPLMIAALGGNTSVYWDFYEYQGSEDHSGQWDNPITVKALLAHGANPNAADERGWTPLLCALVNLPCQGPCPNALMTAVSNHNPALVRLLLAHGARANVTNSFGLTALMLLPRILTWRDEAILTMLAANGARINAASYDGNTALTWAADKDDTWAVRLLLVHGADVNAVNRGGHTALWFAANNGNAALFDPLRSRGAAVQGLKGEDVTFPVWGGGLGNRGIRGLRRLPEARRCWYTGFGPFVQPGPGRRASRRGDRWFKSPMG